MKSLLIILFLFVATGCGGKKKLVESKQVSVITKDLHIPGKPVKLTLSIPDMLQAPTEEPQLISKPGTWPIVYQKKTAEGTIEQTIIPKDTVIPDAIQTTTTSESKLEEEQKPKGMGPEFKTYLWIILTIVVIIVIIPRIWPKKQ